MRLLSFAFAKVAFISLVCAQIGTNPNEPKGVSCSKGGKELWYRDVDYKNSVYDLSDQCRAAGGTFCTSHNAFSCASI